MRATLDEWRNQQDDSPSRSEAIRRLVERALSTPSDNRPRRHGAAKKAAELAAREIEKTTDKSRPVEEQKTRKRRLIKGPGEFRDIRRDQPKRKE